MSKYLPGLNSVAVHVIRRLGAGQKAEQLRNVFSSGTAHKQLLDQGLVTLKSTPRGRKSWYELTGKGMELVPVIRQKDKESAERNVLAEQERHKLELQHAAGPVLYQAVKKYIDAFNMMVNGLEVNEIEMAAIREDMRVALREAEGSA